MGKIIAIIPARYNSKRLPGKPLEMINGKPLIQHVYEKVISAKYPDQVIIATDDQRVVDEAMSFGAQVEMTFRSHKSGTDRCAQVSREFWEDDIIINIQGDEPFIEPQIIDFLALKMRDDSWIEIATLCTLIKSEELIKKSNTIKVVKDKYNKALYFSRAAIPFNRDDINIENLYYKHIGIYAFRNRILQSITKLSESKLEKAEKLEQLRWMENGFKINIFETDYNGIGIDTIQDLEYARSRI